MKFRKKPVVIEAEPYFNDPESIIILQNMMQQDIVIDYSDRNSPKLKIETLEGTMFASVGDWIIKGVNGEYYPIKEEIFYKTYEPVMEEENEDNN